MNFEFEWQGIEELAENYGIMIDKLLEVVDRGMSMGADELLRASTFEVPHDIGDLQSTGNVKKEEPEHEGEIVYSVGYYAPQAHRLHEHPEYNFQKGRKGKYLEDPLKVNALGWQEAIFSYIQSEFDNIEL